MPFRSLAFVLFTTALALSAAILFASDRGRRAELFGLSVTLIVTGIVRAGAEASRTVPRGSAATHSG